MGSREEGGPVCLDPRVLKYWRQEGELKGWGRSGGDRVPEKTLCLLPADTKILHIQGIFLE